MQSRRCLMFTVMIVGKYYLLMPGMHSIRLTVWLHYGMLVFFGQCSRFLFNTYWGYARLFVQGSDQFLLSKEGVTQGDPLSVMMYAIAVLHLIRSLNDSQQWI